MANGFALTADLALIIRTAARVRPQTDIVGNTMSWLVQLLLAALIAINLVVGVGCTNPNARDWETDKFWKDRDPGPANRP
jgi:hypothetical protein